MSRAGEHLVRAVDGWRLSVLDLAPEGPARGLVIAGHAMMVDRRTLWRTDRPCLVAALRAAGLRVLVPDLRGHGKSGPLAHDGGDWSYDQLVEDTAVLLDLAEGLAPDLKIATLGHSLFGHTTPAYLTRTHDPRIAAHVGLCCEVWVRDVEDRRLAWPLKRAFLELALLSARLAGAVPTRRIGFGSADEAYSYFADFERCARTGGWLAADGHDYLAGLSGLRLPALFVLSDADRVTPPRTAIRLWSRMPSAEFWRLGRGAWAHLAPTHMAAVTDPASAPLWRAVAGWLVERLAG